MEAVDLEPFGKKDFVTEVRNVPKAGGERIGARCAERASTKRFVLMVRNTLTVPRKYNLIRELRESVHRPVLRSRKLRRARVTAS